MVPDLAKAPERVRRQAVWAWATHFNFAKNILRVLLRASEVQTFTAILLGSKWSCRLLRIVLQDAFSEVMKVYPPFEAEGLRRRYHSLHGRARQGVDRYCGEGEVDKKGRREGSEVVDHGRRKRGKSKVIASCIWKRSFRNVCSRREGVLEPALKHKEWTGGRERSS